MAQQKDGTTSNYYAGLDDNTNYPTAGEKVTTDVITRLINELDGLKKRLGITDNDTDAPGVGPFWKGHGSLADRIDTFGAGADHGGLTGLGDDDHTQYHNDARGDIRYYTKTLLDGGQLDNRYFRENEHITTTSGAPDAGKPIVTNGAGLIDPSLLAAFTQRSNHKIVKTKSDLPAPSAGVITLADNTVYELNGTISLGTDRIAAGANSGIIGVDRFRDKINCQAATFAITATGKNFFAYNFGIIANEGGGDGRGIKFETGTGFTGIVQQINFENVGSTLCEASGLDNFHFTDNRVGLVSGNGGSGVILAGTLKRVSIRGNLFRKFPGNDSMINLNGSTIDTLNISDNSYLLENSQKAVSGTATVNQGAHHTANRFSIVSGTPIEMSLATRAVFNFTRISTRLEFPGVVTPTALVSNENNYNPTDLRAAQILRVSTTGANYDITGIQAPSPARNCQLVMVNVGGGSVKLMPENVGSSAANRFAIANDVVIKNGGGVVLIYDVTSSRWRIAGFYSS